MKKIRIIGAALLICCLLTAFIVVPASAETESGKCGDNLTYSFNTDTGELTISGTGPMYYYGEGPNLEMSPWAKRSDLTSVKIESGVTLIGSCAFEGCKKLKTVSLPSTVETIEHGAFEENESLEAIDIPEGVKTLSGYSFFRCTGLKQVILPSTLSAFDRDIFADCPAIETITVREGNELLRSVDDVLFSSDMRSLLLYPAGKSADEFRIPDTTVEIGEGAFEYAKIKKIVLPDGLAVIGDAAFAASCLEEFVFPGNIETVPFGTFGSCASLKKVVLNEGVTEIDDDAFTGCMSLSEISLPEKLERIGNGAFFGCNSLVSIELPERLKSIEEHAFRNTGILSISIPAGVTEIGGFTFLDCPSLKTVNAPGVTKVGNGAFKNCASLEEVTLGVPLESIDKGAFEGCVKLDGVGWEPEPPDELEDPVFSDVPTNAYFSEAVKWAAENKVTEGTGDGRFSPDDGCTRGQVVTFLWRSAGCPEPETNNNPFLDVKEDDYFYEAVLWAFDGKVTMGTGDNTFSPDETCTRAQIVTLLFRYKGSSEPVKRDNPFSDVNNREYYYNAVLWAVENKITMGTSAQTFSPEDTCTRAQIVTFLWRNGTSDIKE